MQKDLRRCEWCGVDPLYMAYHDEEWGVPIFSTQALFERLALESMQAGLSWITVLRKREAMRANFFDFDLHKIAAADLEDIARWMGNTDIIRHRGKLNAMVGNAQCIIAHPGFAQWIWSFAPKFGPDRNNLKYQVPSQTVESQNMSKELKHLGFKFVGPTICYAFMQSVGMVNDHAIDCFRHQYCGHLVTATQSERPTLDGGS